MIRLLPERILGRRKLSKLQPAVCRRAPQDLSGGNHQEEGNRHGDDRHGTSNLTKDEGILRLTFQNVNGLGFDDEQVKLQRLYNFMSHHKVDMMGIAEVNINWRKMGSRESLWDRTRGWFEGINVNCSYNINELPISTRFQPGGVASLTTNRLAYKISEKGVDTTKLGRWAWSRYQGKGGRHMTILTVYRPCFRGGINSNVAQQQRYFLVLNKMHIQDIFFWKI